MQQLALARALPLQRRDRWMWVLATGLGILLSLGPLLLIGYLVMRAMFVGWSGPIILQIGMVGAPGGALGGRAVYSLGSIIRLLSNRPFIPWEVSRVLIGIGLGVLVGGALSLAQFLVLRRKLARAGWWISATIAGMLLAELFAVPLFFSNRFLFLDVGRWDLLGDLSMLLLIVLGAGLGLGLIPGGVLAFRQAGE